MEEEQHFFSESAKATEDYIQERLLLFKLQSVEKMSKIIAALSTGLLLALLGFFILFFVSIMLGYAFAAITGSLYIGFGMVAVFYIAAFLIILKIKKTTLEKYITNTVIDSFFDKTGEENDNTETK